MFIDITIEVDGIRKDIKIDSEQKIGVGLDVLRQSGKLPMGINPAYYRSSLSQRLVSAHKTFGEEEVYDGDILSAI